MLSFVSVVKLLQKEQIGGIVRFYLPGQPSCEVDISQSKCNINIPSDCHQNTPLHAHLFINRNNEVGDPFQYKAATCQLDLTSIPGLYTFYDIKGNPQATMDLSGVVMTATLSATKKLPYKPDFSRLSSTYETCPYTATDGNKHPRHRSQGTKYPIWLNTMLEYKAPINIMIFENMLALSMRILRIKRKKWLSSTNTMLHYEVLAQVVGRYVWNTTYALDKTYRDGKLVPIDQYSFIRESPTVELWGGDCEDDVLDMLWVFLSLLKLDLTKASKYLQRLVQIAKGYCFFSDDVTLGSKYAKSGHVSMHECGQLIPWSLVSKFLGKSLPGADETQGWPILNMEGTDLVYGNWEIPTSPLAKKYFSAVGKHRTLADRVKIHCTGETLTADRYYGIVLRGSSPQLYERTGIHTITYTTKGTYGVAKTDLMNPARYEHISFYPTYHTEADRKLVCEIKCALELQLPILKELNISQEAVMANAKVKFSKDTLLLFVKREHWNKKHMDMFVEMLSTNGMQLVKQHELCILDGSVMHVFEVSAKEETTGVKHTFNKDMSMSSMLMGLPSDLQGMLAEFDKQWVMRQLTTETLKNTDNRWSFITNAKKGQCVIMFDSGGLTTMDTVRTMTTGKNAEVTRIADVNFTKPYIHTGVPLAYIGEGILYDSDKELRIAKAPDGYVSLLVAPAGIANFDVFPNGNVLYKIIGYDVFHFAMDTKMTTKLCSLKSFMLKLDGGEALAIPYVMYLSNTSIIAVVRFASEWKTTIGVFKIDMEKNNEISEFCRLPFIPTSLCHNGAGRFAMIYTTYVDGDDSDDDEQKTVDCVGMFDKNGFEQIEYPQTYQLKGLSLYDIYAISDDVLLFKTSTQPMAENAIFVLKKEESRAHPGLFVKEEEKTRDVPMMITTTTKAQPRVPVAYIDTVVQIDIDAPGEILLISGFAISMGVASKASGYSMAGIGPGKVVLTPRPWEPTVDISSPCAIGYDFVAVRGRDIHMFLREEAGLILSTQKHISCMCLTPNTVDLVFVSIDNSVWRCNTWMDTVKDPKNRAMSMLLPPDKYNVVCIRPVNNTTFVMTQGHAIVQLTGTAKVIAGQKDKSGYRDGKVSDALFNNPTGIVLLVEHFSIIVNDYGNKCIRKIQGGVVTTIAGQWGIAKLQDGVGSNALLFNPTSMVSTAKGEIYFMDGDRSDATTYCVRRLRLIDNDTLSKHKEWTWPDVTKRMKELNISFDALRLHPGMSFTYNNANSYLKAAASSLSLNPGYMKKLKPDSTLDQYSITVAKALMAKEDISKYMYTPDTFLAAVKKEIIDRLNTPGGKTALWQPHHTNAIEVMAKLFCSLIWAKS